MAKSSKSGNTKSKNTKATKTKSKAKKAKTLSAKETALRALDNVSELIILSDHKDFQGLAELLNSLDIIDTWAAKDNIPGVNELCDAIKEKTENIILEFSETPEADFNLVCQALSSLQEMIRDGKTLSDVSLPEGLLGSGSGDVSTTEFQLPSHIDEEIFTEFLSRQASNLEDVENKILGLESDEDGQNLASLKRMIHTLKGEAGLLGLPEVERICHVAEDAMGETDLLAFVDSLLMVKDWLKAKFDHIIGEGDAPGDVKEIIKQIQQLGGPESSEEEPVAIEEEEAEETQEDEEEEFEVREIELEGDLELLGDFVAEANEHLDNSDSHLLTIETYPQDTESLNAVFRAFHTIKGVAGFLRLDEIGEVSHESENLLEKARKEEILLEGPAIDVTFEAIDLLKKLVKKLAEALSSGGTISTDPFVPKLVKKIQTIAMGKVPKALKKKKKKAKAVELIDKPLGEVLVEEGNISSEELSAAFDRFDLAENEVKIGELLIETNKISTVKLLKALTEQQTHPEKKLGEILVESGFISQEDFDDSLISQYTATKKEKFGEKLVKEKILPAKDVARALRKQTKAVDSSRTIVLKESIKVDADRLDKLVDLIGEMVIAESMVTQSEELRQLATASGLTRQIRDLDKITRELQEMGTSLRMVPIRPTFQKMARLVRDLSRKSGKKVEFITVGEDTELDKTVVDKIGDPLVHMIRNSMDHGIESDPAVRQELGKPKDGKVELRALHKGGNILIEIEDDGRGLDKDAILKKAGERGILKEGEQLSDKEIYLLIFEPGFSTAKKVTDISGRGVGMDVVRRNIEILRGQVEIRSEKDKGTCFTIRLPLTLAIIDGMAVRVGDERFIIPTLSVVRSIKPEKEDVTSVLDRGELLTVHGQLIPIFRLGELFQIDNSKEDLSDSIIVIVEDENMLTGFLVDDLLGQQQIVIKSLGESMKQIQGLSGGAIMPDGTVGLILDIGGLVKLANKKGKEVEA